MQVEAKQASYARIEQRQNKKATLRLKEKALEAPLEL